MACPPYLVPNDEAMTSPTQYQYTISPTNEDTVASTILKLTGSEKQVLELGCASGSMSRALREFNQCTITGIEVNPEAGKLAEPFCEQVIIADLDHEGLSTLLPNKKFDVIIAADILEHLSDPHSCIKSITALLTDSGYLITSVPNIAYSGVIAGQLLGNFPYTETGLLDATHKHFFTLHELEVALLNANLVPSTTTAIALDPVDSEFAEFWQQINDRTKSLLLSDSKESCTYQWVVKAVPSSKTAINYFLDNKRRASRQAIQTAQGFSNLNDTLKNETSELKSTIAELNDTITELNNTITGLHNTIEAIKTSRSWRITAPLRRIAKYIAPIRKMIHLVTDYRQRSGGGYLLLLKTTCSLLQKEGPRSLLRKIKRQWSQPISNHNEWFQSFGVIDSKQKRIINSRVDHFTSTPLISIIMPTFNSNPIWLAEAIESVQNQLYPNWELCIADDASTDQTTQSIITRYSEQDDRIKIVLRPKNEHISAASNSALELANGEFVCFLDHDDQLTE
ncbi:MAG TPA: glycosyltransferase, partial [Rhodospirillales bacterium]|nr:glycosyltransferase [Rhodospirillales bacterium]